MSLSNLRSNKRPALYLHLIDRSEPAVDQMRPVDMGPLPDLIGYMLRRAQIAVFQDVNRCFAEAAIRPADYGVLIVVSKNPGLNQTAVGDALGIKRSNLVPLVDRLERRGLLERRPAVDDRRAYALTLTKEGYNILGRLDAKRAEQEARLKQRIGADRADSLLDMLHRLAAIADDECLPSKAGERIARARQR